MRGYCEMRNGIVPANASGKSADRELERAVIEFHHRCAGNSQRQQAGQQDRALDIPDEDQQERGIEKQRRDGERKLLDASFGQRNGADHGRQDQCQNHERWLLSMLMSSLR